MEAIKRDRLRRSATALKTTRLGNPYDRISSITELENPYFETLGSRARINSLIAASTTGPGNRNVKFPAER